ncbi:hypothetical protein [Gilliamella sp. ESL0250]|uniref:hypothetical protein n=1 Tax=Gilliamella sp. ESL0250 TaxID=2705036 RepID=UPI00157FE137|nr:hypothetical protein [Gilliamella sp. ESL0250]NUF50698.1 hypothetical protein [Gilliamella sp. ESL0250]
MLWGAAVTEDIANHYAKKKEEHRKACEEMDNPFGKGISIDSAMLIDYKRQIDRYKKEIYNYQTQIANYKLALSNDTEVMYRLFMHRNIFKQSISNFLEKVDDKTKQLFLDTLNELKTKSEQRQDYKENLWNWVNKPNFSQTLLRDVQNPNELDYTAALLFPDVTKK